MTVWKRYWLFQIPGLALVSALFWAGAYWFELPGWACALGLVMWIAKDAALYPFLKTAYEGSKPTGAESLVGARGTAREDLDPRGLVRIGPELWRAESARPVRAGQDVRVTSAEGLTLQVESLADPDGRSDT